MFLSQDLSASRRSRLSGGMVRVSSKQLDSMRRADHEKIRSIK